MLNLLIHALYFFLAAQIWPNEKVDAN